MEREGMVRGERSMEKVTPIAATLGHSLNNPSMSETLSERETCKQERLFNLVKRECDGDRYEWHDDKLPNYCPNCGRKVDA